jgi:hypothetical protein
MATITITLTDVDDGSVNVVIESDPSTEVDKETDAQFLAVQMVGVAMAHNDEEDDGDSN